jgi:bisphosphoglycerate-dependent phosphoglycerate mutase
MQHVQTDSNYEQNVESLKNTIRHLNSAMKDRLIPAMSENDSINLSADMSTLDAMLRKDGMTADDDIMMALKAQQRSESEESGKQV